MKKIIIILVVIVLVAGIVFFFINKNKKNYVPEENSNVKTLNQSKPHLIVPGGETNIPIENMKFNPEIITVGTGTTINWINKDKTNHTIVSDSDDFKSEEIGAGQYYSFTFSKAGEYKYHCGIHPEMKGTIIAQDIQQ